MRVDVWADIVCPWCYVGHERLRKAGLAAGIPLEVRHHAFRLDPHRTGTEPSEAALRAKYGGAAPAMMANAQSAAHAEGLPADLAASVAAPTLDAHRLVAWAQEQGKGHGVLQRLFRAHFAEGADVGDRAALTRLASEAGVASPEGAWSSDATAEAVRQDEALSRELGVRGVPFFVLAGRVGMTGAQPVEAFAEGLRRAAALPPGGAGRT